MKNFKNVTLSKFKKNIIEVILHKEQLNWKQTTVVNLLHSPLTSSTKTKKFQIFCISHDNPVNACYLFTKWHTSHEYIFSHWRRFKNHNKNFNWNIKSTKNRQLTIYKYRRWRRDCWVEFGSCITIRHFFIPFTLKGSLNIWTITLTTQTHFEQGYIAFGTRQPNIKDKFWNNRFVVPRPHQTCLACLYKIVV